LDHRDESAIIFNLTGYAASLALRKLGVFDPSALEVRKIQELLQGRESKLLGPSRRAVAEQLAQYASNSLASYALIDGPVHIIAELEAALKRVEVKPVYVDYKTVRYLEASGPSKQRLGLVIQGILGLEG
jgi:hypothetical protein